MTTQEIWQLQALEAPRVSAAYMRHRARDLARRTQIRNVLDYAIGAPGVLFIAWCCWRLSFCTPGVGGGARLICCASYMAPFVGIVSRPRHRSRRTLE